MWLIMTLTYFHYSSISVCTTRNDNTWQALASWIPQVLLNAFDRFLNDILSPKRFLSKPLRRAPPNPFNLRREVRRRRKTSKRCAARCAIGTLFLKNLVDVNRGWFFAIDDPPQEGLPKGTRRLKLWRGFRLHVLLDGRDPANYLGYIKPCK